MSPRSARIKRTLAALVPALALGAYLGGPSAAPPPDAKPRSEGMLSALGARVPYVNRARARNAEVAERDAVEAEVIAGYVYNLDGAALEGAAVAATTFEVAGNLPSIVESARADARGRFELRVAPGTYQVHANQAGYGPAYAPAHSGETVSLILPKSGVLRGRVLDEGDAAVPRFSVDVLTAVPDNFAAPAPLWSRHVESAEGTFTINELPSWPVIVRVTAEGHAPTFSRPVRVGAGEAQQLDFKVAAGCTLEGFVKNEHGEPVAGVFIDAEARLVAGQMNQVSMEAARQAESDEEGRFSIEHVPHGPLLVRGYDGGHAVSTAEVEVEACDQLAPVQILMARGRSLVGTARQSDGTPLPFATLTLTQRAIGYVHATADAAGHFRFDGLPTGTANVELMHEGQRTVMALRAGQGEVIEQDLTLYPAGKGELDGRILARDKPLQGVQILIASNRGKERGFDMRYAVTDSDGVYRVLGLPGGHYLVSVMSSSVSKGVQVEDGRHVTLDLDIAEPRPHAAR